MRQLNQSKFKKGTTEYQNVASPNGEVKALKVESGQLKYSTDYSQFNEIGKVYTAGNGISIDENGNAIISCLSGAGAPTTSTEGSLYQFYYDTTNAELYQCRNITSAGDPVVYTYTWAKVVNVDTSNLMTLDTNQKAPSQKLFNSIGLLKATSGSRYARFRLNANDILCIDESTNGTSWTNDRVKIRWAGNAGNEFRLQLPAGKSLYIATGGLNAVLDDIIPEYSNNNTYAVGDLVSYWNSGNIDSTKGFYKCIVAITTQEAWTSAHWQKVTLQDLFDDIDNKIGDIDTISQTLNNGGGV